MAAYFISNHCVSDKTYGKDNGGQAIALLTVTFDLFMKIVQRNHNFKMGHYSFIHYFIDFSGLIHF